MNHEEFLAKIVRIRGSVCRLSGHIVTISNENASEINSLDTLGKIDHFNALTKLPCNVLSTKSNLYNPSCNTLVTIFIPSSQPVLKGSSALNKFYQEN